MVHAVTQKLNNGCMTSHSKKKNTRKACLPAQITLWYELPIGRKFSENSLIFRNFHKTEQPASSLIMAYHDQAMKALKILKVYL